MRVKMFDPGNFTPYYVENLCNALAALGMEVDLITSAPLFEQTRHERCFPVEEHFFKWIEQSAFLRRRALTRRILKVFSYPAGLWRTWRALRTEPAGIFHVQWALVPLFDVALIRKLRSRGWRIVYTAHEVNSELGGPLRRWLYGRIYRLADVVIVHTPALAAKLRNHSGGYLKDIRTVPEGVSTFPFSPNLDRTSAQRSVGLECTGPVLLFFGLIKRYKGLDYLLRAWPRVVSEFPNARLLIVGEAMLPARTIREWIRKQNIADSVILRLGYVPSEEAQFYFRATDAVVLPYIRISTSSIVPTAYRFERPVIATSVGGLPELVEDGETGFVVPPCDSGQLAEAICRGLRDPHRLAAMGVRGRAWFNATRRWDDVARQTMAAYTCTASDSHSQSRANAV